MVVGDLLSRRAVRSRRSSMQSVALPEREDLRHSITSPG